MRLEKRRALSRSSWGAWPRLWEETDSVQGSGFMASGFGSRVKG